MCNNMVACMEQWMECLWVTLIDAFILVVTMAHNAIRHLVN